jgi:PEP-CTERM motif
MKKILALCVAFQIAVLPASAAELLINGGFETGAINPFWNSSRLPSSRGNVFVSAPGLNSPLSGFATAPNPVGGSSYVITDQSGSGTYIVTQSFLVPINTRAVTFSYQLFANNQAGVTIIDPIGLNHEGAPNQHVRVDILTAGSDRFSTSAIDVVRNFYLGSDPFGNPSPFTNYSFDITSIVQPGTSYQVRFAEVDNQGFFQLGFDNVSVSAVTGVPEPASWVLFLAGFGLIGIAIRRQVFAERGRLFSRHF